nr:MAG TPA: hypothetical protein [Caudoviricetes sp.]
MEDSLQLPHLKKACCLLGLLPFLCSSLLHRQAV